MSFIDKVSNILRMDYNQDDYDDYDEDFDDDFDEDGKRDWVPAGNESCRADPQVGCRWSCVERERRGDGSA